MLYGKVIGHATSTVRHESLVGRKLLIVLPLGPDGRSADGDPVLAIDRLGAGGGDKVVISSDGKFVSETIGDRTTPIRWSVLGIVDDGSDAYGEARSYQWYEM